MNMAGVAADVGKKLDGMIGGLAGGAGDKASAAASSLLGGGAGDGGNPMGGGISSSSGENKEASRGWKTMPFKGPGENWEMMMHDGD